MGLISCPICTKEISAAAVACPNCGHPVSKSVSKPLKPVVTGGGLFGAFATVLFLLVVLAAIAAAVTKPNESALRGALTEKYGLIYGAGAVAEKLGLLNVQYHDYLLFSSLSVQVPFDAERTVAYGIFGKTILPDVQISFGSNQAKNDRTVPALNENSSIQQPPPQKGASTPVIVDRSQYSEEQLRRGLQQARQALLSNEMHSKASNLMSGRHPFSNIEQCNDPNIQSFNTSLYGEEIVGVYTCRMRGKISGKDTFIITVRIRGAITFQNDTFVRQIVGADVITDGKEN